MKKILIFLCGLVLFLGGGISLSWAKAEDVFTYGGELTGESRLFYEELEDMKNDGTLARGGDRRVTDGHILSLAEEYSQGNGEIMECYNNALKSFAFDNPDLFYIDFNLLNLTITKTDKIIVTIGRGRGDEYLLVKEGLEGNISRYEDEICSFMQNVKGNKREKISYIYNQLSTIQILESGEGLLATSYSALINGRATCEGIAKLFKSLLDRSGIENALVEGYCIRGEGYQPTMYNYIKCEEWLGADVTLSSYGGCLLEGKERMATLHIEGSGVFLKGEVNYPDLQSQYQSNDGRLVVVKGEKRSNTLFDISYDGLGLEELEGMGLYPAIRRSEGHFLGLGGWMSVKYLCQTDEDCEALSDRTRVMVSGVVDFDEYDFAILSIKADSGRYDEESGEWSGYSHIDEGDIVASFKNLENLNNDEGYIYHPTLLSNSIDKRESLQGGQEISLDFAGRLSIEDYSKFELVGDKKEYVTITLTCDDYRMTAEELETLTKIENISFDGVNNLSFLFTPSPLLKHNNICYTFHISNLVGGSEGNKGREILPINITFGSEVEIGGVYSTENVRIIQNNSLQNLNCEGDDCSNVLIVSSSSKREAEMQVYAKTQGRLLSGQAYNLSLSCMGRSLTPQGMINIKFPLLPNAKKGGRIVLYYFDGDVSVFACGRQGSDILTSVDKLGDFYLAVYEEPSPTKILTIDFDGLGGNDMVAVKEVTQDFKVDLLIDDGYEVLLVMLDGREISYNDGVEIHAGEISTNSTLVIRLVQTLMKDKMENTQEGNYLKNRDSFVKYKGENNLLTALLILIFFALAGFGFVSVYRKNKVVTIEDIEKNGEKSAKKG